MSEPSYQKQTADRQKLLKKAKDNFKKSEDLWKENRQAFLNDVKFVSGEQWPELVKRDREKEGRPTLVVDKLNQYRRQVANDARQNRPQPKVFVVGEGGHDDAAEAFLGVIRDIWSRSNADEATDWALDQAVCGGMGYIRVVTEYEGEDTFNQVIRVKRIRNPLTVLLGAHESADGADVREAWVVESVPVEEFEARYPKAKKTDWGDDKFAGGWYDKERNTVRVCEYFYTVEESRTLYQLENGDVIDADDYEALLGELKSQPIGLDGIAPKLPEVIRNEVRPTKRIKWCKLTGAEILEESDWLGKYIPIVPVYGDERDIGGKRVVESLIRHAKDAQRLYNFSRSAYAERVALAPKAPWIAPVGAVDNYEEWKTANSGNHQVLRYDPVDADGNQIPPPTRIPGADVPAGLVQDMQMSEHDIQGALGMYQASLGQPSNEKSGKAILARKSEGDNATFHFQDNLNRAIRHIGRILVDLIPEVYDTRRTIRILGEDGESEIAEVNPDQESPVEDLGDRKSYNLKLGSYDVDVVAGPSYSTRREETVNAMIQLTQANPALFQLIGDIMVRNMDWPESDVIADRLKTMLPPPIQQMEAQKGDQQIPPQVQAMLQQASQHIQGQQQQLQQAGQAMQELQAKLAEAERQRGIEIAQVRAEKAQTDAMVSDAQSKVSGMLKDIENERKLLDARYEQLSALLELQASKLMVPVPPTMPPGYQEPAISPN